ncbi:MAG: DNA polymerase III subunit gamma/tau [Chloroflexi bacterium]|nr:MAG: DNA polymerase III subunit gamma/tau [Chloroflexota bacterium]
MSQALYRKWRPAKFEDVVGQEHITETLQHSVAADRVGHAYLFCGPRGTGKTTSARLLAKAVNCLQEDVAARPCNECANCVAINEGRFLDLIEIDAASNTGVDDIRNLRDKINFAPNNGRFKVYIIDEVHMLSTAAFNALLKTLEEPPPHAKFVLATTEEHKVPVTIKSRCQQFNFRLFTVVEISQRLQWLADKEELTIEPEAMNLIARQGGGSMRDSESLLDQLVITPGDTITLERAQKILGTASETAVVNLTDAWLAGNGSAGLTIIHEALASGTDSRQFCRQMVAYLRELLLLKAAGPDIATDSTAERQEYMLAQAQRAPRQALIDAVKGFNEAALTPASSWQPQLPLELAYIDLLPAEPAPIVAAAAAQTVPTPTPAAQPVTPQPVQQAAEPAAQPKQKPPVEAKPGSPPAPSPPAAELAPQPVAHTPPATTLEEPAAENNETPPSEPESRLAQSTQSPLSLADVTGCWPEMVNLVGRSQRNLPALLNMSKPLALENHTIILGFDFPIFKDKFDKHQGAHQLVGEVFSHLLQTKCAVRGVVTSDYTIPIRKEEFDDLANELGGVVSEQ